MKTPLNQLIEYLDEMSKLNNVMHTGLIAAKTKAKLLLEEEKKTMIEFAMKGITTHKGMNKIYREQYERFFNKTFK